MPPSTPGHYRRQKKHCLAAPAFIKDQFSRELGGWRGRGWGKRKHAGKRLCGTHPTCFTKCLSQARKHLQKKKKRCSSSGRDQTWSHLNFSDPAAQSLRHARSLNWAGKRAAVGFLPLNYFFFFSPVCPGHHQQILLSSNPIQQHILKSNSSVSARLDKH